VFDSRFAADATVGNLRVDGLQAGVIRPPLNIQVDPAVLSRAFWAGKKCSAVWATHGVIS
jgi:hypothetical protein